MPHDEPELVEALRDVLRLEGIAILEGAEIASIEHAPEAVVVHIKRDDQDEAISGSHLLVAAGRICYWKIWGSMRPEMRMIERASLSIGGFAPADITSSRSVT